jgi:hypothetical protein
MGATVVAWPAVSESEPPPQAADPKALSRARPTAVRWRKRDRAMWRI